MGRSAIMQGDLTVPQHPTGALIQTTPLVHAVGLPCDVLKGQRRDSGKLAPLEHADRPAALVYMSLM